MNSYILVVLAVAALIGCSSAKECGTICPSVYQPVRARCGSVTRQFGNRCKMNVYNCQHNAGCRAV